MKSVDRPQIELTGTTGMNSMLELFERKFGYSMPTQVEDLLTRKLKPHPFGFCLQHFVFEIQYALNLVEEANYDVANQRILFAVTTDGYVLSIDLDSPGLDIIQDEGSGQFDAIGVTVKQLVDAETCRLPDTYSNNAEDATG